MNESRMAGIQKSHFRFLSVFLSLCLIFAFIGRVPAWAEEVATDTTVMHSDTTGNITMDQGTRMTIKITGATTVLAGTPNVVYITLSNTVGNDSYYEILASGAPGSSTGLYMSTPGQPPQKFCAVTIAPNSSSTHFTQISYSENYYNLRFSPLKQNEMMYSEVKVSDPNLSLSIVSNNEDIVEVTELQKEDNRPGYYVLALYAVGEGYTTLTITASDGTVDNMPITVKGVLDKDYTLTADTTQDFTVPQNGSYFMKVNFTYNGPTDDPTRQSMTINGPVTPLDVPLLVSDNPNIQVTPVSQNGHEFLFRIDAFGAAGQSAMLYAGSYNYLPEELCKVTVGSAPKNIRLDTVGEYQCNIYDTYRFVVYTNANTPPTVGANNSLVSVSNLGKVNGGYEYRMTADRYQGYSLIQASSGGETVSFPVLIDNSISESVESDTQQPVFLAKGESYTYKFTIMGGGEPSFGSIYNAVPAAPGSGIMSVQLVKKDGLDYYVKVTATSDKVGETSYVSISFPHSVYYSPNNYSGYGSVQIKAAGSIPSTVMKSDTTSNFTLKEGASYTFKITGATSFAPGTSGVFRTELVKKSGSDSYYKVTAIGQTGQQVGFYMSNGKTTQKVCMMTVGASEPIQMKSDTTSNFTLEKGNSYTFKITGATSFHPGTDGPFKTELVRKSGNDSYYKITAIGEPGQQAGFYMSAPDQTAQKVCVVTVN